MLNLIINIKIALLSMRANKLRSSLSMLGVIIGVSSVVIVGAIGSSGKNVILDELNSLGTKSVFIWTIYEDDRPTKTKRSGFAIENDDLVAIRDKMPGLVERIAPICGDNYVLMRYRDKYCSSRIIATTPEYHLIRNDKILFGRFLVQQDIDAARKVCVVGVDVVKKLFGKLINPIGKEIYHMDGNGLPATGKYKIVGVLQPKDTSLLEQIAGFPSENERIVIPIAILQRRLNIKEIDCIYAQTTNMLLGKKTASTIKNLLHIRHEDKFKYKSGTLQDDIELTNKILGTVSWIAVIAACISLIIGGIGIMNIMISSVVERTKEIGIRKSLGATNRDILFQFLTESIVISVIGGIIGCIVGIGTALIIELASNRPRLLAVEFIIIALFVSIVVGILSGMYPAMRAGRLDPVEALKYE